MKKKLIKILCCALVCCLISYEAAQPARAFSAEGIIMGGAASGATISLTAPQVALLLAASYGLVFAVTHADELANGLRIALEKAAEGVDAGSEQLAKWWEKAQNGFVSLVSAPAWILSAIRAWIASLYAPSVAEYAAMAGPEEAEMMTWIPIFPWSTADSEMIRLDNSQNPGVVAEIQRVFMRHDYGDNVAVRAYFYFHYFGTSAGSNGKDYGYELKNQASTFKRASYKMWSYNAYISKATTNEFELQLLDFFENVGAIDWREYPNSLDYPSVKWLPPCNICVTPNTSAAPEIWFQLVHDHWANLDKMPCAGNPNRQLLTFSPGTASVCPDVKVGGIENTLAAGHSIDAVNMPDLDIAGSQSVCPDVVIGGSVPVSETISDVITGLGDGTMTWTDFVTDVGVGTPTISLPVEGDAAASKDYAITDTGVSEVPVEEEQRPSDTIPEGVAPYAVQLKDFFPFCIPFDIAAFVNVLCAEPEAPCFEWVFPKWDGTQETLTIDLSSFDEVASLLRDMELLLFCIALAMITRNQIRG